MHSQEAIEQLMSSNKLLSDEIDNKQNAIDEAKDAGKSANHRNYSWWHWRRSNDNADKKSPPKTLEENAQRSQSIGLDEGKEVNPTDSAESTTAGFTPIKEIDSNDVFIEQNTSMEAIDAIDNNSRNDDSISSELANISKASGTSEKYRKTLRLTSDQIVSCINSVCFAVSLSRVYLTRFDLFSGKP